MCAKYIIARLVKGASKDTVLRQSYDEFVVTNRIHIQAPQGPRPRQGVYFIRIDGFIKIGIAGDVLARWSAGGTDNPHPIEPLGFIPIDDCGLLARRESELHARFSGQHHRGEWFRDHAALRELIAAEAKPWPRK